MKLSKSSPGMTPTRSRLRAGLDWFQSQLPSADGILRPNLNRKHKSHRPSRIEVNDDASKHRIRFDPTRNQLEYTICLDEYSDGEMRDCFYNRDDLTNIFERTNKVVIQLETGNVDPRLCARGIDKLFGDRKEMCRTIRSKAINAVMDLQEDQWESGNDDLEQLAKVSRDITKEAAARAVDEARQDIRAARSYLHDVDTSAWKPPKRPKKSILKKRPTKDQAPAPVLFPERRVERNDSYREARSTHERRNAISRTKSMPAAPKGKRSRSTPPVNRNNSARKGARTPLQVPATPATTTSKPSLQTRRRGSFADDLTDSDSSDDDDDEFDTKLPPPPPPPESGTPLQRAKARAENEQQSSPTKNRRKAGAEARNTVASPPPTPSSSRSNTTKPRRVKSAALTASSAHTPNSNRSPGDSSMLPPSASLHRRRAAPHVPSLADSPSQQDELGSPHQKLPTMKKTKSKISKDGDESSIASSHTESSHHRRTIPLSQDDTQERQPALPRTSSKRTPSRSKSAAAPSNSSTHSRSTVESSSSHHRRFVSPDIDEHVETKSTESSEGEKQRVLPRRSNSSAVATKKNMSIGETPHSALQQNLVANEEDEDRTTRPRPRATPKRSKSSAATPLSPNNVIQSTPTGTTPLPRRRPSPAMAITSHDVGTAAEEKKRLPPRRTKSAAVTAKAIASGGGADGGKELPPGRTKSAAIVGVSSSTTPLPPPSPSPRIASRKQASSSDGGDLEQGSPGKPLRVRPEGKTRRLPDRTKSMPSQAAGPSKRPYKASLS